MIIHVKLVHEEINDSHDFYINQIQCSYSKLYLQPLDPSVNKMLCLSWRAVNDVLRRGKKPGKWSIFRDGDDNDAAAEGAAGRPAEAARRLDEAKVDDDGDDRRRDEGGEGGVEAGVGAVGVPAQGG